MGPDKANVTADVDLSDLSIADVQFETIEEARCAIADILKRQPELQALLDSTETVTLAHTKHRIKQCMSCEKGKKHFIGRNKLPAGRLGRGGISVCDHCGAYDSSNLS